MENQYFIALVLFTLLPFIGKVFSDNTCEGDWEPYKNEKCLKVFDAAGLISYAEAENFCKQKYDANLVSIGFEDKQKFLEDFLKSQNIVDYVWIGLKYESNNNYVWSDNTDFVYSNWASDSPRNDSNYCVQIETDDSNFGTWAEVLCTKKNLVLCEKVQPWPLSQIQSELMNIKKNMVPVGFIYVQLPKENPPSKVWPLMTWEDVTADYAGLFFRAEGGNSGAFGSVQEDNSPRLIKGLLKVEGNVPQEFDIPADNQPHVVFYNMHYNGDKIERHLYLTISKTEVRPRNMAIRIWKRTQ